MVILWVILGILAALIVIRGLRIVRPTERGLVERFGKYNRFAQPGLNFVIPLVERLIRVHITEEMVDAERQEIITKDNLNAIVDAQVYFKVKDSENDVRASQYRVNDYRSQIVNLSRTTLRNVIGSLTLMEANSGRNRINKELQDTLVKETHSWGIEIVRTELKEINPPAEVQQAMNKIVIAENAKLAAKDFAAAKEMEADGERRATIKKASGTADAAILEAEAKAKAIAIVNKATTDTFTEKAQLLRKLETVEKAFSHNSKILVPAGQSLVNVIGDLAGVADKIVELKKK